MSEPPTANVSSVRKHLGAIVLIIVGAILTEVVTGAFSGVGVDLRTLGAWMVQGFRTPAVQNPTIKEPPKQKGDAAACKQKDEIVRGAGAADAAFEKCLENAKRSLVKRWAPEKYCENEELVKRAYSAGREAWKAYRC